MKFASDEKEPTWAPCELNWPFGEAPPTPNEGEITEAADWPIACADWPAPPFAASNAAL